MPLSVSDLIVYSYERERHSVLRQSIESQEFEWRENTLDVAEFAGLPHSRECRHTYNTYMLSNAKSARSD